jgi:hypothetical protein
MSSIQPEFVRQISENKSVIKAHTARGKGNSPIANFQTCKIQFVRPGGPRTCVTLSFGTRKSLANNGVEFVGVDLGLVESSGTFGELREFGERVVVEQVYMRSVHKRSNVGTASADEASGRRGNQGGRNFKEGAQFQVQEESTVVKMIDIMKKVNVASLNLVLESRVEEAIVQALTAFP